MISRVLCILKYNPYFQSNASANRWRTIAEGLQKRGIILTVFLTGGFMNFSELRKYGFSGIVNGISYNHSALLLNNNVWFRRVNKYIFSILKKGRQRKKFSDLIDELHPEIVWVGSSDQAVEIFCNTYDPGKHRFKVFYEVNEYPDLFFVPGTRIHDIYFNEFIGKVDLMVCMTKELIKYFGRIPLKADIKIHHMPMTVDISRFENIGLRYGEQKPYIAYCGGLNNDKDGLDILIYSFEKISMEFKNINLLIAGPKEFDGDKNLDLIRKLNLSDRIKYLGVLNRDEIPYLICNAALLALPRPSSRQAQGGFPTKLGEYLASGRPVCATIFGAIPEYLSDEVNAFLAKPGEVSSFTDALMRALTDKPKAEEVGRRGKEAAILNFSMESEASRLFDFIQKNEAE